MKMKRVSALILALLMMLVFTACGGSGSSSKSYNVGIVQLVQHVALDAATEGFKAALTDELGDKVKFDVQNASGDSNACATIANNFVSKNVDLIMANATPALQAAANATTTIPILGTSITEYGVALNIKDFNGLVGGNVSGTSDLAPLDEQAKIITDLFPDVKTVGLLYCSAEPNSLYQVNVVKEELEKAGLKATLYAFSDANDIAAVCTNAVNNSDLIYVPTDNTAASSAGIIDGICRPAKKPVVCGEEGICSGCGTFTLSIDYYDLGYATGLMAAKILKGESKVSEMPIEYAPKFTKKYNAEICKDLGITVPEDYTAIEAK
ncbi:MAG: ABC transporter substrate-binding protein [Clostridia bacterium]|nr:ABC transporter substrate-binding protein [Clostridia bacterium]